MEQVLSSIPARYYLGAFYDAETSGQPESFIESFQRLVTEDKSYDVIGDQSIRIEFYQHLIRTMSNDVPESFWIEGSEEDISTCEKIFVIIAFDIFAGNPLTPVVFFEEKYQIAQLAVQAYFDMSHRFVQFHRTLDRKANPETARISERLSKLFIQPFLVQYGFTVLCGAIGFNLPNEAIMDLTETMKYWGFFWTKEGMDVLYKREDLFDTMESVFTRLGTMLSSVIELERQKQREPQLCEETQRVVYWIIKVLFSHMPEDDDFNVGRIFQICFRPLFPILCLSIRPTVPVNSLPKAYVSAGKAVAELLVEVCRKCPRLLEAPVLTADAISSRTNDTIANISNDPLCIYLNRALLLVPDRREWRAAFCKYFAELVRKLSMLDRQLDDVRITKQDVAAVGIDFSRFVNLTTLPSLSVLSSLLPHGAVVEETEVMSPIRGDDDKGEGHVNGSKDMKLLFGHWVVWGSRLNIYGKLMFWIQILLSSTRVMHKSIALDMSSTLFNPLMSQTLLEILCDNDSHDGIDIHSAEPDSIPVNSEILLLTYLYEISLEFNSTIPRIRCQAIKAVNCLLTTCIENNLYAPLKALLFNDTSTPFNLVELVSCRLSDVKLNNRREALTLLNNILLGLHLLNIEQQVPVNQILNQYFTSGATSVRQTLLRFHNSPSVMLKMKALQVVFSCFLLFPNHHRLRELMYIFILPHILDVETSVQDFVRKSIVEEWLHGCVIPEIEAYSAGTLRDDRIYHLDTIYGFDDDAWGFLSVILDSKAKQQDSGTMMSKVIPLLECYTAVFNRYRVISYDDICASMRSRTCCVKYLLYVGKMIKKYIAALLPGHHDPRNIHPTVTDVTTTKWNKEQTSLADKTAAILQYLISASVEIPDGLSDINDATLLDYIVPSIQVIRTTLFQILCLVTMSPSVNPRFEDMGFMDTVYKCLTAVREPSDDVRDVYKEHGPVEKQYAILCLRLALSRNPESWEHLIQDLLDRYSTICSKLTSFEFDLFKQTIIDNPSFIASEVYTMGDVLSHCQKMKCNNNKIQSIITVLSALVTNTIVKIVHKKSDAASELDLPTCVRGASIVALGKACLTWDSVGRKQVDVIASLMDDSINPILQCNALTVLSDLSVNYSNMIEQHLDAVSLCLSSQCCHSEIVRRTALALLGGLIASDYVKIRDKLGYRLITSLCDPCTTNQDLAVSVLQRVIMIKNAAFIRENFGYILCAMNGLFNHSMLNVHVWAGGRMNKLKFSKGMDPFVIKSKEGRTKVYLALLRCMNDIVKLDVTKMLVNQFVGSFIDDSQGIPKSRDSARGSALFDALRILSCKQIQITFEDGDTHAIDEEEHESIATAEADKKRKETQLIKETMKAEVVPTLLTLKKRFEDETSIFQKDIRDCIGCLLYMYRSDLNYMLENDEDFARQLQAQYSKGTFLGLLDLENEAETRPIESSNITVLRNNNMTAAREHMLTRLRPENIDVNQTGRFIMATAPRLKTDVQTRRASIGAINENDEPIFEDTGKDTVATPVRASTPGRTEGEFNNDPEN